MNSKGMRRIKPPTTGCGTKDYAFSEASGETSEEGSFGYNSKTADEKSPLPELEKPQ